MSGFLKAFGFQLIEPILNIPRHFFCRAVSLKRVLLNGLCNDHIKDGNTVTGFRWRDVGITGQMAHQKLIKNHAKGVNISSDIGVLPLLKNFRGTIGSGLLLSVKAGQTCHSKIKDFCLCIFIDKNILRVERLMDDAGFVSVFQAMA